MRVPNPSEKSGPLAGHVRKGRIYRTPLAATGMLHAGDWVRDDLPDLLWPTLVLSDLGTAEGHRFLRWQKAVQDDLAGNAGVDFIAECLDGRLTSLDRLAARVPRARAAVRGRAEEFGLLPEAATKALDSYPLRPAGWLTGHETAPPGQEEIDLLARAVLDVLTDGHREAVIKCLPIWSAVQAGTFRSDAETIELLKPYPTDPRTRSKADSAIRAMWGASREMALHQDESRFADAIQWAKVFWGANSMFTHCVRSGTTHAEDGMRDQEEDAAVAPSEERSNHQQVAPGTMPEDGAHLRRLAMDLLSSYIEALETSRSRLYDHEQQEVISGLVARAGRDVITALGVPDLWCLEHGAHIARVLVETRIYIQWMAQQDPSIYRAFQDYGAGKAKLYARILDELPPEARRPDFEAAVEELKKLSHSSELLDNRVVDTRDSFAAGKSIRTMADECGLLDLYRQTYYMASGVAHSEWWSIETHAMERCINVLHGGHLIPSLSLNPGGNVEFAATWVDQFYTLIRIGLKVLQAEKEAVEKAFSWLEDEQGAPISNEREETSTNPAG